MKPTRTPALWQPHEFVNENQLSKLSEMDRLMFDCWRKGLKRRDILDLAKEIESSTTEEDVSLYFKAMFDRELSPKSKYLVRG
ncbi:hypothetical protein [Vibrio sp. D431a]|uniref:hypothetical protein n=1 Tax=Vibrio sp. D431a TaxID=2837388 RepID=UPI002556E601|nr:hypothetical protein [Vibrio sp. D431a]MDK9790660.1 hypothetical protein [Vibrio sp. D431a]